MMVDFPKNCPIVSLGEDEEVGKKIVSQLERAGCVKWKVENAK
ncbi:MAG: hypothetical protein HBSAPP04_01240 [Ignavibacteriaceae bacterium]|nr:MULTISPECIES: hypothetical protein [Brocadia]KXK32307.1 MAG: hypothetical protein UZ01_00527 [Candidatus Brocadia sinica]GJQ31285.1 MAG: hypothetical protein HBSAPP04_01240 [Ignavibacteriaceae bacterium]